MLPLQCVYIACQYSCPHVPIPKPPQINNEAQPEFMFHLRQDRFGRKAGRVGRRKKRTSSVVGEKHTASYLLTHLHIQHTLTIVWPSYYCSCADLRGESLYLHPQPHAAKCGQQQAPLYVATMLMIKVQNS